MSENSPKSKGRKPKAVARQHTDVNKSKIEHTDPIVIGSEIKTASEITNMEVHHHPEIEKKGLKEYLLEGLMIFLAVTMGFFAENLRERISDSHRENEFAKALYSELRDDSTAAADKLRIRLTKEKDLDYLRGYFKDSSLTTLPRRFYPAYTNGLYLINKYSFEPKDGILSQLRNSGSLRYFKSVDLQKLLGDLSVDINNMRYRNDQEYQFFASPLKPFLLKHFDFNWLDQFRNQYTDPKLDKAIKLYMRSNRRIEGVILNVDLFDRGEAANMIYFYKQIIVSTNKLQLTNYITTNKEILRVLRKDYPLLDNQEK